MEKTKAEKKISKVYNEYKEGTLHSGKGGPVVKSQKQAIAIALSANGIVTIANAPSYLRANVTAWTSGSITAKVLY